ncbi:MAG: molecular chaperone HtpG [Candidatus Poribacteria bacterium]|nr:molecular chaperone HtpG [Candidatus Poribacteria bacterium]
MTNTSTEQTQEFEYKAEMKQLLHLIVHSLYMHPEVFLRELISNASDALNRVRFRQLTDKNILNPDAPLRIDIAVDSKAQTLSITDIGIGMTKEDLTDRIGTVASSGTLELLQRMKEENRPFDGNLIGQFGIGFYSLFMVTDEVTIETRHADADSNGYRWQSIGEDKFSIKEIERAQRGTTISFKLKDEAKEFSESYRVEGIIKKYSNFVDFPVSVNGQQINTVSALWQKNRNDVTEEERNEFYKFISDDYNPPLGHLHLSIEGRVNFKALIFIPETAPLRFFREEDLKSLHLYSDRVFIQDDCKELLPDYLRFVSGVVDTEDLPLNVSREVTQSSPVMAKIREVLTGRILSMLEGWVKNDPEKYEKFFKNFGLLFKTGVSSDFANKDRLVDLLRFESTKTEAGKLTALKDYVAGMPEDQTEIYYLSGDSREAVERNPNLEYFKKRGIEVLFFIDPADIFNMPLLTEYDKKSLKSIENADLELKPDEESQSDALTEDEAKPLIAVFKETLGDKVEDVVASKRLVDSAATLVVGAGGMDAQMERMMRMMNQEYSGSKKILEINPSHPLIKNLAQLNQNKGDETLIKSCILQLYEGALLIDGNMKEPAEFVARMTGLMEQTTR